MCMFHSFPCFYERNVERTTSSFDQRDENTARQCSGGDMLVFQDSEYWISRNVLVYVLQLHSTATKCDPKGADHPLFLCETSRNIGINTTGTLTMDSPELAP